MTVHMISADHRRDTNPYERALWVVAGVLVPGSVAALVWAHDLFASNHGGWTDQPPVEFQYAQMISSIAPSALSGGIILAGMALAIRALSFNRRTADTHLVPAPHPAAIHDNASVAIAPVASGRTRATSVPVDHTPYMRPQSTE
jgi:hypothetical protein